MATERRAVIESACQDLSSDDRAIASLDKGEAIVSSTFTKFAVPVMIPKFEDLVEEKESETKKEPNKILREIAESVLFGAIQTKPGVKVNDVIKSIISQVVGST